ncbi:MAG: hypothetical protein IPI67_26190 [Myxococcales bacterium]|nr:hypothetical protein [Myxococcales bacterium]
MAAVATEAGPASTPAASERPATDVAAPPFYFAVLGLAALAGAAHEVFAVQPALYVPVSAAHDRLLIGVTGLGAMAFGMLAGRSRAGDPFASLPWAFSLASFSVALSAPLAFIAFGRGEPLAALAHGNALATGATLGACLALAIRALGRTLVQLDAPWRLANPFRLLGVALMCGVAAGAASMVGPLRAALALAMVLAALGAWTPSLRFFLERRSSPSARLARVSTLSVCLLWLVGFLACERLLPTAELHRYANPVVFFRETERAAYAVTSGQEGFELFVDGRLTASTLDERRYFEALVQPTLGLAKRRAKVLIFGGGTGLAEREVLRHSDVESVTVVVVDRSLPDLARRLSWLRARARDSLDDARIHIVEREPIVWLSEGNERFDLAIVDLPDPETPVEGKNFTRFFYRRLKERLAPGGLFVVQATSPFSSPVTFDSIVATLRAEHLHPRPYHAAVPSLGEWGFVLGFVEPPAGLNFEPAARWLSGTTVAELAYQPKDFTPPHAGRPATLHDQTVVEEFGHERAH